MMVIKDIHIWSLHVFCGVFLKQAIKEKDGEKGKKGKFLGEAKQLIFSLL